MMAHELTGREQAAQERNAQKRALILWLRDQAASREGVRHWYVVRCKRDNAEAVAGRLAEEGMETWCPLKKVVKRLPRRQGCVTREIAVLPRYFFVRLPDFEAAWLGIMTFDGIDCLLGNQDGQPTPMSAADIDKIKGFRQATPDRSRLYARGDRALIKAGPLADLEGDVTQDENRHGVVALEVALFGGKVACRIGIDDLDKLT